MTDSEVSLHGDTDCEVHGACLGYQANLETQSEDMEGKKKTYRENYWSDKRKYLFIII